MTDPDRLPEDELGERRSPSTSFRGFAVGLLVAFLALWVVFAIRAIDRNDAPAAPTPSSVSFVDRIYSRQIGFASEVSSSNGTPGQGRTEAMPVASPGAMAVVGTPANAPTASS